MSMEVERAEYLMKVTTEVWGINEPGEAVDNYDPQIVTFIFGVDPDGLTPFEMALSGKTVNDELMVDLKNNAPAEYLGHVLLWFMPNTKVLEYPYLRVKIKDIRKAGDREVIKAMAEIAEISDHCSCC